MCTSRVQSTRGAVIPVHSTSWRSDSGESATSIAPRAERHICEGIGGVARIYTTFVNGLVAWRAFILHLCMEWWRGAHLYYIREWIGGLARIYTTFVKGLVAWRAFILHL